MAQLACPDHLGCQDRMVKRTDHMGHETQSKPTSVLGGATLAAAEANDLLGAIPACGNQKSPMITSDPPNAKLITAEVQVTKDNKTHQYDGPVTVGVSGQRGGPITLSFELGEAKVRLTFPDVWLLTHLV